MTAPTEHPAWCVADAAEHGTGWHSSAPVLVWPDAESWKRYRARLVQRLDLTPPWVELVVDLGTVGGAPVPPVELLLTLGQAEAIGAGVLELTAKAAARPAVVESPALRFDARLEQAYRTYQAAIAAAVDPAKAESARVARRDAVLAAFDAYEAEARTAFEAGGGAS
jgi:hypothetical protein